MASKPSRQQRGFTLIEMVVVVMMVGILASAAMPLAALHKRRAQEADLRQALRTVRTAIDDYKRAWDQGRIEKKADETGYPPSLEALVQGVPDATSPKGERIYFLRRLPRDPFADDPSLPEAATWGLRSYASPPDAPAPGKDVFDVHVLRDGTAMDGTFYRDW
ncbi:type II secretion system protein [Aquabacterium sp.]|uniref:type II secretion system protein n=1 Tax=Aquabacterium sp. TaxID=1872578 RepID=UPI0024880804|nr:type II secretion system protein [Aquabacterium sp.]MDI1257897.1 type II secretion system protein [Aquabacterium sp.]